jgi:hypothetical protein
MDRRNFLAVAVAAPAAGKRRKRAPVQQGSTFTDADKQQLLKAFSDAAILVDLERRLLSIYSVDELEREAKRRGLR